MASPKSHYETNKARCPYLYGPLEPHFRSQEITYVRKRKFKHAKFREYLENTHAPTHNFKLKVVNIYAVNRKGEYDRYKPFAKLKRKLLWHGTEPANLSGIMSQGFKINLAKDGMFGKAIYFTDISSKAAQYCKLDNNQTNGFLLLCEVALGHTSYMTESKHVRKLRPNFDSIKVLGEITPDPKEHFKFHNSSVIIPAGKLINSGVKSDVKYNEYTIYNEAQVLIKYLVEIQLC